MTVENEKGEAATWVGTGTNPRGDRDEGGCGHRGKESPDGARQQAKDNGGVRQEGHDSHKGRARYTFTGQPRRGGATATRKEGRQSRQRSTAGERRRRGRTIRVRRPRGSERTHTCKTAKTKGAASNEGRAPDRQGVEDCGGATRAQYEQVWRVGAQGRRRAEGRGPSAAWGCGDRGSWVHRDSSTGRDGPGVALHRSSDQLTF